MDDKSYEQALIAQIKHCKTSNKGGLKKELIYLTKKGKKLSTQELEVYIWTPSRQARSAIYFNTEAITNCNYTNSFACVKVLETSSYGRKDGSWLDITPSEIYMFISLLIYFRIYHLPTLKHYYWRRSPLLDLPWPQSVMSRKRFTQI